MIAKSNAPLKEVKDFYGGESMNITLGKAFARIGTKSFSETGISCHGALPEGSVNAGYLLSKRLCAEGTLCNEDLKQLTFISKLLKGYYGEVFGIENDDKTFGKLTCTNGMIGTDDGKPYLTFDIRYGLDSNDTYIKKKLKDFFTQNGWSVEITHEKKPFIISEDNVYLQKCLKAYKRRMVFSADGRTYGCLLWNFYYYHTGNFTFFQHLNAFFRISEFAFGMDEMRSVYLDRE